MGSNTPSIRPEIEEALSVVRRVGTEEALVAAALLRHEIINLTPCEDTWVPSDDEAERILVDMRIDRLVELVRDGLGQEQQLLPQDAPKYMRRDNDRHIKAHIALTELANRAYGVPDA